MERDDLGRLSREELLDLLVLPAAVISRQHEAGPLCLQQRYRTHRDSLYVFLHRDDIEPTTNSSERDLRPSVVHRKVIGSFRSS